MKSEDLTTRQLHKYQLPNTLDILNKNAPNKKMQPKAYQQLIEKSISTSDIQELSSIADEDLALFDNNYHHCKKLELSHTNELNTLELSFGQGSPIKDPVHI